MLADTWRCALRFALHAFGACTRPALHCTLAAPSRAMHSEANCDALWIRRPRCGLRAVPVSEARARAADDGQRAAPPHSYGEAAHAAAALAATW